MKPSTLYTIKGMPFEDYFILRDMFSEGNLWIWGVGIFGILGNNSTDNKNSPVQTVAGGTNWKQVSCGHYHTAAIKTDGTLWTWGYNNIGALGNGTSTSKSSPIQTIAGGTNWKQVACGYVFTAAIKTDGTLWTWGNNGSGELGDETTSSKSSPVQTIAGGTNWKQVDCNYSYTAAIKTDGTLWLWGTNNEGYLGDETTSSKSSPIQTVAGGTNWKQVSCGGYQVAAIKTDGTLWTWGANYYGQLGDNTTEAKSSPIQTLAGGTNWKQVASGDSHVSAIKTDGTLWAWGYNIVGNLGDNTVVDKSSPVQTISGGTNWKQVSCAYFITAAIKTDGTLWLWGENGLGYPGDNTTDAKSSPVQTVAGGTNWKQVSCGYAIHIAAVTDIE